MAEHLDSFEKFALDATPMLYRTAWLLAHEQYAAEDLVQETLARIFPRWTRGSTSINNPNGYARTALVRLFLKINNRMSSSEMLVPDPPEVAGQPGAADLATRLTVRAEIDSLAPMDRAILVLRYYHDRSVAQVAKDLGLSDIAVRSRSSRSIAKLRTRLGVHDDSTNGNHNVG